MHCGTFFALFIVASTFSYALWPLLCASTPSSMSLFNRAYVLLCDAATLLVLRAVAYVDLMAEQFHAFETCFSEF